MGKKKKLTDSEINKAIRKVRDLYNDYIIRYEKSPSIKEEFEFRLGQAQRIEADMATFLHAEVSVVYQLAAREQQKRQSKGKPRPEKKGPDFADRIMEQHREQIAKYPELDLPDGAAYEIRKLFGMFEQFDRKYWPDILKLLREVKSEFGYGIRMSLETHEAELCLIRRDPWPPVLNHYCILLTSVSKNWDTIEKEQQNCIKTAAFFIHRLVRICEIGLKQDELKEETQQGVENVLNFLHSVLTDFRLHDLKPNDLKEFI